MTLRANTFDAVVMNFGVLHLAQPDLAAQRLIRAEQQLLSSWAPRVERPGNLRSAEGPVQVEINQRYRHFDDAHPQHRGLHPQFQRHGITEVGDVQRLQSRHAVCFETAKRIGQAQTEPLIDLAGNLTVDEQPLRRWLAGLDATQVAIDPDGAWQDPDGVIDLSLGLDPASTLFALANRGRATPDPAWLQGWRDADAAAARAIDGALGAGLTEPRVAAELGSLLPAQSILLVASSMPIRDVETFFGAHDDGPRVVANRGANGIDGLVSTAYGIAASRLGPAVLLIGDVALAHDAGGLLIGSRLGIPLTIVVLDNGGGGIFDFLPVASQTDVFEEHVATPPGIDVERLAALHGARYAAVASSEQLAAAIEGAEGTTIVHVRTDRAENVELHRRVWAAVAEAIPR